MPVSPRDEWPFLWDNRDQDQALDGENSELIEVLGEGTFIFPPRRSSCEILKALQGERIVDHLPVCHLDGFQLQHSALILN